MIRSLILLTAVAIAGCTGATGVVEDASTGRPIAGATLQASNSGWGRRDGDLVWDKEKIATTTSGPDGRFRFDVDGGVNLRVTAQGYPPLLTSFCPRDTRILIGGPFPGLQAMRRLVFADALQADDEDRAHPPTLARDVGLSGEAFDQDSKLRIRARGGIRFVSGTGAIPPPPPLPYPKSVDLDFGRDCGWLFVSDGKSAIAVVEARTPSGRQDPGEQWRWSMLYTPLPTPSLR